MTTNQTLDLAGLQALRYALDDVIGYLTDNGCGDPDCCGDPFYTKEDYKNALEVIACYGLKYAPALEQSK